MAAKKPAAAKTSTPAAEKKPRKPKTPAMSMAQRFDLMSLVKSADSSIPDARLADVATKQLGRTIQRTTIGEYRKQFGIAPVGSPTRAQLTEYVEELKRLLAANGVTPPAMGSDPAAFVDDKTIPLDLEGGETPPTQE